MSKPPPTRRTPTDTERLDFLGSLTLPHQVGVSWRKNGMPYWACDGKDAGSPRAAIDAAISAQRARGKK